MQFSQRCYMLRKLSEAAVACAEIAEINVKLIQDCHLRKS